MRFQVIKMSDRNKCRLISFKASMAISLCFLTFLANAEQRLRNQRQTIATGLTNTGISFNSMNEGQNSIDPYYDYQPQQERDIGYNRPQMTNWRARGGNWRSPYDDYQNGRAAERNGNFGLDSYMPTRDYDGAGKQTWRGFGAGKNSYGYGRPSWAYPQRGTKTSTTNY